MHTDQHILAVADLALDHCEVLATVDKTAIADCAEFAELGLQHGFRNPLNLPFRMPDVCDEVGDRHHDNAVFISECTDLGCPHHFAVVVLDLDTNPGRSKTGETTQIDGCLGVSGTAQHSAWNRPQREHVTGPCEVGCGAVRICKLLHGDSAITCRDTRCVDCDGVNGHGVRGALLVLVHGRHRRNLETVKVLADHRYTDHTG